MKNLKKKFIWVIILFIIFILWTEIYKTFITSNIDRNSYVVLIEWKANLNNLSLMQEKKELLKSWDRIETIWEQSLAMVKWWDWSITRLWGDSVLVIEKSEIEQNLLNIKISFKLEKGKTWSDVISFIWEDSYFHETFADTTAAVRWTTFEVNLEKDYLYVSKHEVKLTKKSWEKKIVTEKKPFIISKFDFTELLEFLQKFKDAAWQDLNKKLDKDFYNSLIKNIWDLNKFTNLKIEDISEYSEEKKKEVYNKLLSDYQKLNFIDTSDTENYKEKLKLKKSLINLSDDWNKHNLLITTIYDIKDLAKNKNFSDLTENIKILSDNKDLLSGLDIDLSNYINSDIFKNIILPDWLRKEFENSFNNIKTNLNLGDLNFDNDIINSLKDSATKSINDVTDTLEWLNNLDLKNITK